MQIHESAENYLENNTDAQQKSCQLCALSISQMNWIFKKIKCQHRNEKIYAKAEKLP